MTGRKFLGNGDKRVLLSTIHGHNQIAMTIGKNGETLKMNLYKEDLVELAEFLKEFVDHDF